MEEMRLVTEEELLKICGSLQSGKVPGMDRIPNVALKTTIRTWPDLFLDMYMECLTEGIFTERWKRQRLVLLPKGNKPPGEPSSYRPLCMLNTMGKVLERITDSRLEEALTLDGDLADSQYGFKKSRSTKDAVNRVVTIVHGAIAGKRWRRGKMKYCAVIMLDIKNAFNSARWDYIWKVLGTRKRPPYLMKIIVS